MSSKIVEKLTGDIQTRDIVKESDALVSKWTRAGLLEGISDDLKRVNMARLLENQAKQILKEASTMGAGDVEGYASVAFPLVRRVFGNLLANDLVSVQPMNLPAGLIFFLDFQYNSSRLGAVADDSVFGQGIVGKQLTGGVDLSNAAQDKGPYNLNNGYSLPTASFTITTTLLASGTVGDSTNSGSNADVDKLCNYDPDLSGSVVGICTVPLSELTSAGSNFDEANLVAVNFTNLSSSGFAFRQIRRLTSFSGTSRTVVLFVVEVASGSHTEVLAGTAIDAVTTADAPIADNFDAGGAIGSVVGADVWGLEADEGIPELDIKVDSIALTAITRKLKAKWSPELGQDLNAYHNVDAEVELTSILAEHIELEIDREILEDLTKYATASDKFWSRLPGKFVNEDTGSDISNTTSPPDFTGNVSEWYETLIEKVNGVSAVMQRKILSGGANFIVCSPEVANILEFTNGFRGNVAVGEERGTAGAVKSGQINKKFDVYVDPYYYRNGLLVGRKGSSFLESGFVYAPYVPLQMTPTIFGTEDFVPRKGVMTRYAKKMVRPDFYGKVIVLDLV
jgi:hypothetical protein